jgi:hypothetical protein
MWHERWLWLGGALLTAILWANLTWLFRRPHSGATGRFSSTRLGASIARLTAWRFSSWLLQFLRLLYYIGLPIAALLLGHDAVMEKFLGLKFEADTGIAAWVRGLGWAAALGVTAWALLALGWWTYRRALAAAGQSPMAAGSDASGWVFLREALYHEVHWAFYRNAFVVVWGVYWGAWCGLALIATEAVLSPAWRGGLADPQKAPAQLMRGALAVVSSALFLLTQNLWLALAVHWGVSWGLAALVKSTDWATTGSPSIFAET